MENIFGFEYTQFPIANADGTASKFRIVRGVDGNVIHCPKKTWHLITTGFLSETASLFPEVQPYTKKNGAIIGFTVPFGIKMSHVGAKQWLLNCRVDNQGYGVGTVQLVEKVMRCTNGQTYNLFNQEVFKFYHNSSLAKRQDLARLVLAKVPHHIEAINEVERDLNTSIIDVEQAQLFLAKWFYNGLAKSENKPCSLSEFRRMFFESPEELSTKTVNNYNALRETFKHETLLNKGIVTKYTVIATVTNVLSRQSQTKVGRLDLEKLNARAKKVDEIKALVLS